MSNPFIPITALPTDLNPYWINESHGGINKCIVIDGDSGSVLANCTGWAYGAFLYHGALTSCTLSTANANEWYTHTTDGYERGIEPQLGAVICYLTGGAGHVASVEEIAPDGSYIKCSESNYGGDIFDYRTRYRSNNWQLPGSEESFQGFIYNPSIGPGPGPSGRIKKWLLLAAYKRRSRS